MVVQLFEEEVGSAGFNEARADSPGKSGHQRGRRIRGPAASMRPGLIRPGNSGDAILDKVGKATASMRPGLIRPGNRHRTVLLAVVCSASMRPGLIRPGNVERGEFFALFMKLQ